ncbi:hypothetical protein B1F79_00175 [Coxiella-like endosymbiont of Rhipicephalus sanguineus]|uniref:hypothetical protein n=1 Tax=Coxiella-like endosymbiont of Rhipicephalus sanguineus TaxID=1955402 RepID=UPI0020421017|nr:hypothetical protein [Coxiella-like endosymbiont of Rhipicephalus sanguineus]MBT8506218.1 hypothetical protein [Coxiella-like endosymbiont of Rhipicephalus sanguineus]
MCTIAVPVKIYAEEVYIRFADCLMSNQDVGIAPTYESVAFNKFISIIIEGYYEDNIRQWGATVMRSPAPD